MNIVITNSDCYGVVVIVMVIVTLIDNCHGARNCHVGSAGE